MKKIAKFLLQVVLWLVAWVLMLPIEIATFVVVVIKHGWGALDYFDKTWYKLDVVSASRNRSLRNAVIISTKNKQPVYFTQWTKKTISWHIWANYNLGTLTRFGYFLYCFLYVVDVSSWNKWGHCQSSVEYFKNLDAKNTK